MSAIIIGKRVAWWPDGGNSFLNCRGQKRFNSNEALLVLCDRLVQGESMEILISELETQVTERKADFNRMMKDDNSGFYHRDRYGNPNPSYPSQQAHLRHTDKIKCRLDCMKAGTFGPTHTIRLLENGDVDHCSVKLFKYQGS